VKEKVAERIRIARLSKGLSQQNVADELGITVAAYSNIERGVTDISVTRAFQIADVLSVNPSHLLMESKPELVSDSAHPSDTYSSSLTQQVYMLIQQVQQLSARIEQLDKELNALKNS
jgi:transcriptional regulator with XRE-family HTH domain